MSCDLIQLVKVVDAVDTNIQDQTTDDIDFILHNTRIAGLLLLNDTVVESYDITLTPGHGATAGEIIVFQEGIVFTQCIILSVALDVVTLDCPMDKVYTPAAFVHLGSVNMAVDGSVTPVVFEAGPLNAEWDICRAIGSMIDDVVMDDSTFGGIPALARGILFRKKDGVYKNLFNSKSNGDLALRMFDVSYAAQAKFGEYGLRFRRTWNGRDKSGVVIRLNSADNEKIQVVIQDDLTDLISFKVVVHGQVVED